MLVSVMPMRVAMSMAVACPACVRPFVMMMIMVMVMMMMVMVIMVVIVAVVVMMIMAIAGIEKFRLDLQNTVEIEGAALQHVG